MLIRMYGNPQKLTSLKDKTQKSNAKRKVYILGAYTAQRGLEHPCKCSE
jgi:hypothetical protein